MNPVNKYLTSQKEPFQSMAIFIKTVIEKKFPELSLKYKWKVPFFYLNHKPCCYINVTKKYVDVGFSSAPKLQRHAHNLVVAGRKQIRSLRYTLLEEVDERILVDLITEAIAVHNNPDLN